MSVIWKIARHEYITNVRRPAFILVTLMFPAMGVIALVITAFFSGQAVALLVSQIAPPQKVNGIVDQSHLFTPIPVKYAGDFVQYPDEATAKSALIAGKIGAVIVIPPDYVEIGKVTGYTMGGGLSGISAFNSFSLDEMLVSGLLVDKVDPKLIKRASAPSRFTFINLDQQGKPTTDTPFSVVSGFIAPYIFSILLVVSIFSSSGYLLRSVSEEKETRVIEIVLSSVSPMELLAGKVSGLGALGLTQVIIWLVSAAVLSGGVGLVVAGAVIVFSPISFALALVYFLLGYMFFSILMATAGSLGTNLRESQQLAGLFTFGSSIPYMISGLLITNPNALIARIFSFIPFTAPTMMMIRLPMGNIPTEDIVGSIVVLILTIPIVLWAGAKVFRMGLLMYGKRPSIKEIARVLRSA